MEAHLSGAFMILRIGGQGLKFRSPRFLRIEFFFQLKNSLLCPFIQQMFPIPAHAKLSMRGTFAWVRMERLGGSSPSFLYFGEALPRYFEKEVFMFLQIIWLERS